MYEISNIITLKKMDYCVWNVVFQMDGEPLNYSTDFLYLIKEKKWVCNSLITHELTSLMQGNQCIYCGEDKIACFIASRDYQLIKQNLVNNTDLQKEVEKEINLSVEQISTEIIVINDKAKWEKIAEDNRFYGNILRIKKKNENVD
ncbi:hypothetical protein BKP45_12075 [Anaerobacillus alkalidiazotrophicus]|uniref:Uncharacterized protein n=1 Tax=Anaerobacillus alkalidiazotrophicus TaxID=472963 RepID=A0A1S2M1D0_9BACI|nr:hypothetical protein [Anaerobacillus alkalidiazotrophicus]OIJ18310.1 hypothetical protein BKP45_17790 [Anaerobacillus alkalidiazotrophicus]OIJ19789.1 hypothetical protein BKP45_12075 [Anaerobacillus alkalidiazotrophicus]